MPISFTRYVDITSGIGAGATVARRDLILRLFTASTLVPPSSVVTMTSADEVGQYFGTTSDEYARAVFYFGWISKNISRPPKISFARFAETATAPMVYGIQGAQSVATYTGISDGSLSVTLGATTETFTGLDFTGAASLSAVATVIEDAVQTGTGAMWTAATVVWDATARRFVLTGGATGAADVAIAAGATGTDVAILLGWLTGAIDSAGADVATPLDTVLESTAADNNFGSFGFMPVLSIDNHVAVATWNQSQNVRYIYTVPVSPANAEDWNAALIDIGGTALTLSPTAGKYPELIPAMVFAATRYDTRQSVQNYMFQRGFDLPAAVSTDERANTYDALRINYYGVTQTAGQSQLFYQRGYLCGNGTEPTAINVYANEIWLKDAAGSALLGLMLNRGRVSANAQGRADILSTLQGVITEAQTNGVISQGATLTTQQQLYVTEQTGDDRAFYQIQTDGYWLGVSFDSFVGPGGQTEYKAVYTLMYKKDDAINKIEGSHVLL